MDAARPVKDFFVAIETDPRIGAVHIAVFMALYYKWLSMSCCKEIRVFTHEVMFVAKVSSRTTYCEVVKGLRDYGYISYEPSFNRKRGSKISFIDRVEGLEEKEDECRHNYQGRPGAVSHRTA